MGGTTNVIDLDLQGPDALSVELKGRITNKLIVAPKTITLGAGQEPDDPDHELVVSVQRLAQRLLAGAGQLHADGQLQDHGFAGAGGGPGRRTRVSAP